MKYEVKVIEARNVNYALPQGIKMFMEKDALSIFSNESRAGPVRTHYGPVATIYTHPRERVLFSSVRNANPFFHFFESLWILAGQNDVEFISYFLPKFVEYSDDGKTLHGAYGARMRNWLCHDQIVWIIDHLANNPNSRRAIISLFDPAEDHQDSKDIPCNLNIAFDITEAQLNMTVFNRSNDMVWGAYGANAVQFSMLQELIACCLRCDVGVYTQISNNFHVYEKEPTWKALQEDFKGQEYWSHVCYYSHTALGYTGKLVKPYWLFNDEDFSIGTWYRDLEEFINISRSTMQSRGTNIDRKTNFIIQFFDDVAMPLFNSFVCYKNDDIGEALTYAHCCKATDWCAAAVMWLKRIQEKRRTSMKETSDERK